jgi:hypothetical protein
LEQILSRRTPEKNFYIVYRNDEKQVEEKNRAASIRGSKISGAKSDAQALGKKKRRQGADARL